MEANARVVQNVAERMAREVRASPLPLGEGSGVRAAPPVSGWTRRVTSDEVASEGPHGADRTLTPVPSPHGRGERQVSNSANGASPPQVLRCACAALAVVVHASPALAGWDVGGEIAGELRVFPHDPAYPGQLEHWQPSISVMPDIRWESDDKSHQFVFVPFARLDAQDDQRTHYDLREAYYRYNAGTKWSLTLGAAKVFWGRAESRHLVDIVNQTDAVEDIDEEDKLGQPMANLALYNDWGKVDLCVMSGFRDRTFAGREGRPRFGLVVDTDRAIFEADARRKAPDFAVRYSHYLGDFDFGVAAFHGTSREPRLAVDASNARLLPVYDRIFQASADLQYTAGAWLLKGEAIWRAGQGSDFFAAVVGFEYTLYQLFGSNADLGLLAEYLHDGRDEGFVVATFADAPDLGALPVAAAPFTIFEDDVFAGARLALNDPQDTALLAGAIFDASDGTTAMSVEASRRFGTSWTADLEARFFVNVDAANIASAFRDDDFVTLRLTRHF